MPTYLGTLLYSTDIALLRSEGWSSSLPILSATPLFPGPSLSIPCLTPSRPVIFCCTSHSREPLPRRLLASDSPPHPLGTSLGKVLQKHLCYDISQKPLFSALENWGLGLWHGITDK
ncbi:hypothetical protein M430DRAFT_200344 [Amorphotheca resinae ATCC 22711]|uniref:Uncharacterized protein n=1 Tax=Amorphotheca resinae ATCC 22711 TaxID=857342 RepID=A0A2T3BAG6_AMORE|nr:hypothetical protein M430DRAFT_200344 [Amorphotheca resinae ATCC 22711]PSS25280.1 hypothetical protein M430DRAFT_200344 [Amorphotheca resinae ATCC 22711]